MKKHYPYFLLAFALIILYFSIKIVQPFIIAILTGIVLAYICFPFYKILLKYIKNKTITSLIISILLLLIIIIPSVYIINALIKEGLILYNSIDFNQIQTLLIEKLNLELTPTLKTNIDALTKTTILNLINFGSEFLKTLPQRILNFFIIIFTFFFALRDGEGIIEKTKKLAPFKIEHKNKAFNKIKTTIDSLIYGEIAISILEGIIASAGFYLIGIRAPIFLGLIVAIFALLPIIGPAAVYIPIVIYNFLIGDITTAIILLLFGILILSVLLDTTLKPKLLGLKGHIHPMIIIIGVFGGITLFGLVGLMLGPIILVLLQLTAEIYFGIQNDIKS